MLVFYVSLFHSCCTFSLIYRVSALERILKSQGSPCDSIQELKEEVGKLRNKLENYEHLSWLGELICLISQVFPISYVFCTSADLIQE